MFPQFGQWCHRGGAAAFGVFVGQHLHGAVHPDGKHLFDIGQIGIDLAMLHIGAIAADAGLDRFTIGWVRANRPWQREQHQGAIQFQRTGIPALGQAGARRFRLGFGGFTGLNIGAEPAIAQGDRYPVGIHPQHLAIDHGAFVAIGRRQRAGIAAFGIVRTTDEGATGPRGFQVQIAGAAHRTDARV